jgi:hypothetical protein
MNTLVTAGSSGDRWAGLIPVAVGLLLLPAARLWWLKIVGFNRRTMPLKKKDGPPLLVELFHRWWGTLFLGGAGLACLVDGLVWVAQGHP